MTNKSSRPFDGLIKLAVTGLLIITALLFSWPFLQKTWVTHRILHQQITYDQQLPARLPDPETIKPFEVTNVIALSQPKSAIGQVAIPRIGLVTNVFAGLTNDNLSFGSVALFPDRTVRHHNVVLIGHNMGVQHLHFGALKNVVKGDAIYLSYLGHEYRYRVYEKTTIRETDINRVKDTMDTELTLITCSVANRTPYRILVSAALQGELKPDQSQKITRQVVKKQSKQAKDDLWWHSWLPLILIGVLLVVFVILVWRLL